MTCRHYKLVIHCGACMWNRREMLSRILRCQQAGVPITNYGLTIAYSLGIFERALSRSRRRWNFIAVPRMGMSLAPRFSPVWSTRTKITKPPKRLEISTPKVTGLKARC